MRVQQKEDRLPGLILGGFALLMFHLIVSGSILLYISLKLVWLSKLATALLACMALAKIMPVRRRRRRHRSLSHNPNLSHGHGHNPNLSHNPHSGCCEHGHTCALGHHHHSMNPFQMALFVIPLLIGFIMHPRILGANALANSINTAGPVPFYAISDSNSIRSILKQPSVSTLSKIDSNSFSSPAAALPDNALAGNSEPIDEPSATAADMANASGKQPEINAPSASKQTPPSITPGTSKQTSSSNTPGVSKQTPPSTTPGASKQTPSSNTPSASKQAPPSTTPGASKQTPPSNTPSASKQTSPSSTVNPTGLSGSQSNPNGDADKTLPSADTVAADTDLVQLAFKIYDHPDQAYGKTWRLTGFVYKDPKLEKNQFVITRILVTCCMADASPIGIIAETADAPSLKPDTWLEVEGTLQKRVIKGTNQIQPVVNFGQQGDQGAPFLAVTSWKTISAPSDPYMYP